MGLLKRTYSISPETVRQFEEAVKRGTRSTVVADLMRKWLEDRRKEALRKQVVEGCKAMSDEYAEMEADFHPLEEEAHRGFEP